MRGITPGQTPAVPGRTDTGVNWVDVRRGGGRTAPGFVTAGGSAITMLHRPWSTPLVVGFWCVTTGWLVVSKILPTFESGTPPETAGVVAAVDRLVPVGWTVSWNGNPIGWAVMQSRRSADGGLSVESRLHCDRLPLDEVLPAWAGALMKRTLPAGRANELDASGRILFDPSNRLRSFVSTVTLPGAAERVVLAGRAKEADLVEVSFHAGDLRYETTCRIPAHAMLGDELSPQAMLPGLYEGRRWTLPVYSPLRPGRAPLQILHARVDGEETIFWGDRLVIARVVSYREDPSSTREPRCRLWVDRSGKVLRHESAILGAKMEFVRRSDAEAARLAATAALEETAADQPREATP